MFVSKREVESLTKLVIELSELATNLAAAHKASVVRQAEINAAALETYQALSGYYHALHEEFVGMREEINVTRVQNATLLQKLEELNGGNTEA